MSGPPSTTVRRRLLVDLTPLRASRPYRWMLAGAVLSAIGTQFTNVAVMLQVYELTGSSAAVGQVGLFALVPLVTLGLYGGSIVDAYDRRTIVRITASSLVLVASLFALQGWLDLRQVWLLYALVAVQNGLFAVNNPARMAIVPRLLPAELLPAANALSGLSGGVAFMVGPVLAGQLVERLGYGAAYTVQAVLLAVALLTLLPLPALPPQGEVRKAGLTSVIEGLRYLRTRPNVRMTFLVDLAAMILAMPRALFPAIGTEVFGGGGETVGYLAAGVAAGALIAGLFSGPLGLVRRQGLAVSVAVAVWGCAVAAFGVVVALTPGPPDTGAHPALWAAVGCLVVAGAADAVSAVFRHTILQAATPDHLRGRLQGVFIVVVAGGPQLGDVVLGNTGEHAGEAVAAVAGGLACLLAVLLLSWRTPGFIRYDARHPTP